MYWVLQLLLVIVAAGKPEFRALQPLINLQLNAPNCQQAFIQPCATNGETDSAGVQLPQPGTYNKGSTACYYILPKGSTLYHGTMFKLDNDIPSNGKVAYWFTADIKQSCGHVLGLRMQNLQGQPDWLDKDHLCSGKGNEPAIYEYETTMALHLLLGVMGPDGHAPIQKCVGVAVKDLQFAVATNPDVVKTLAALCNKDSDKDRDVDGWRQPYDQDEFALCPSVLSGGKLRFVRKLTFWPHETKESVQAQCDAQKRATWLDWSRGNEAVQGKHVSVWYCQVRGKITPNYKPCDKGVWASYPLKFHVPYAIRLSTHKEDQDQRQFETYCRQNFLERT